MSPSGGAITTVEPAITWSPENSRPVPASSKHRWFEAWPGVWTAVRVTSGVISRSPSTEPAIGREGQVVGVEVVPLGAGGGGPEAQHLGSGGGRQAGRQGRVVDVGVGDHHPTEAVADRGQEGVEVGVVVGPGVDDGHAGRRPSGRCWSPDRS